VYINENVGHGIFAKRNFDQHEYIATYTGFIELSSKQDNDNAFVLNTLMEDFVVDASQYRSLSSFINHSNYPNAISLSFFYGGNLLAIQFVTIVGVPVCIIVAVKPIAAGDQICIAYSYRGEFMRKHSTYKL
jgi:SET domain-containing protein